jgi:hypothetical protein
MSAYFRLKSPFMLRGWLKPNEVKDLSGVAAAVLSVLL